MTIIKEKDSFVLCQGISRVTLCYKNSEMYNQLEELLPYECNTFDKVVIDRIEKPYQRRKQSKAVEVFFCDLDEAVQDELLRLHNITNPKEMNWDSQPIFIFEK